MILHKDTNLPISFISKAYLCSRAVGRIVTLIDTRPHLATGFMISGNFLVTCKYVIPDFNTAMNSSFQIDYYVRADGSFNEYSELKLDPSKFFATSEDLDVTVVAIKPDPKIDLSERCLSNISLSDPVIGESINVIQHILGEPQKISLRDGQIREFSEFHLHHDAPTLAGSSGAAIFNDQWELIGIHEKTIWPDPSIVLRLNCGIRISAFFNWFNMLNQNSPSNQYINTTGDVNRSPGIQANLPIEEDKEERDSVFISYAHRDQEKNKWQDRLELHLKTIESIGTRRVWQDGRIKAGSEWKKEIESALKKTKVAVLLIGPNFLNSEFVLNKELPNLLEAAKNEGVKVIPLITHRVAYNRSILSKFQSFNSPQKPLQEQLRNGYAERTLVELVEEVAKIYESN